MAFPPISSLAFLFIIIRLKIRVAADKKEFVLKFNFYQLFKIYKRFYSDNLDVFMYTETRKIFLKQLFYSQFKIIKNI